MDNKSRSKLATVNFCCFHLTHLEAYIVSQGYTVITHTRFFFLLLCLEKIFPPSLLFHLFSEELKTSGIHCFSNWKSVMDGNIYYGNNKTKKRTKATITTIRVRSIWLSSLQSTHALQALRISPVPCLQQLKKETFTL